MRTLAFTYTKKDGVVSDRFLVEMGRPSNAYEGLDVTDMSDEDFTDFAQEYNALKDVQSKQTQELLDKYELRHSYRKFLESGISDIKVEYF